MTEETTGRPFGTVTNFEFGDLPDPIQVKDLVGWNVAIIGTGQQIQSEQFVDEATGEMQIGHIAHMVAYNPDKGFNQDGEPNEWKFTDPFFPGVVWQKILKKVVERSVRLGTWYLFTVTKTPPNAKGRSIYVPIGLRTDEVAKDQLYKMAVWYAVEEAGLAEDADLSALAAIVGELEASPGRAALTTDDPHDDVVEAEIVES